ncbi:MAG: S-layer homology domain-containing protein, partial [Acidimicrobiales bacterium]
MTSERHPPRLAATAAAFAVLAAVASISAPSPAAAAGYVPGPCISNAGPGPHPFVDVAGGAFYADAVAWMFSNGITRGVTPDRFGPDRPVTRAEFAAMLHRMACEPVAAGVAAFADLVPGAFYRAAVDWMVGENITMGKTATSFGPDDPMTRGELATFLYRFVDEPTGAPGAGFVANDPASFHAAAVDWLVFRSITRGTSAITFSPGRTITRGEVATFLHRLNTIGDVALVLRPVLTGL